MQYDSRVVLYGCVYEKNRESNESYDLRVINLTKLYSVYVNTGCYFKTMFVDSPQHHLENLFGCTSLNHPKFFACYKHMHTKAILIHMNVNNILSRLPYGIFNYIIGMLNRIDTYNVYSAIGS